MPVTAASSRGTDSGRSGAVTTVPCAVRYRAKVVWNASATWSTGPSTGIDAAAGRTGAACSPWSCSHPRIDGAPASRSGARRTENETEPVRAVPVRCTPAGQWGNGPGERPEGSVRRDGVEREGSGEHGGDGQCSEDEGWAHGVHFWGDGGERGTRLAAAYRTVAPVENHYQQALGRSACTLPGARCPTATARQRPPGLERGRRPPRAPCGGSTSLGWCRSTAVRRPVPRSRAAPGGPAPRAGGAPA